MGKILEFIFQRPSRSDLLGIIDTLQSHIAHQQKVMILPPGYKLTQLRPEQTGRIHGGVCPHVR